MQTHPTPTQQDDDAYYRAVLHDLIDRGQDLARRLHERATAQLEATPEPGTPEPQDPTIAFDRVARAIRRTIALARHIAAGPARPTQHDRTTARAKIIRAVEDHIDRKRRRDPDQDTESLRNELAERLEDPDLDRDLAARPVEEIIEEIARDLGIAQQARSWIWKRRTPADIATLKTQAAADPTPSPHLRIVAPPPRPPPPTP